MKHVFLFTGESSSGKTILARITNADETTVVIHDLVLENKRGFEGQVRKVLNIAKDYTAKCKNIIIVCTKTTAEIFKVIYNDNKDLQENYMLSILNFERIGDVKR